MKRMIFPRGITGAVLGALLMLALLYLLGWVGPGPRPPAYTDVEVDSAMIVQGEPEVEVGIVQSIVTKRSEPTVRATASGAAAGDVASFCIAAGFAYPAGSAPGNPPPGQAGGVPPRDSLPFPDPEITADRLSPPAPAAPAATPVPSPSGLPPALRPMPHALALGARSGAIGRRQSEFWLPTSAGDLVRETYRVRPPFTFRVDGDSLVIRESRFGWIRELEPLALCAAGGVASYKLDSRLPVFVGCGLGAIRALR